jgi:hypothetical protein
MRPPPPFPGFSLKAYMDYFDLKWSSDFLRTRAYPFARAVGDFYMSYAVDIDGVFNIPFACAQEGCGQAGSESGSVFRHNNTAYDIAFYKRTFRALLEWSVMLGVDADMRPTWQTLLDNVVEYPTTTDTDGGVRIFAQASFTDGAPKQGNNECARYPIVYFNGIFPGEDIDLDSDPGLVKIAADTVTYVNRCEGDDNWERN